MIATNDGNDSIKVGNGNNLVDAGNGNDTIVVQGGPAIFSAAPATIPSPTPAPPAPAAIYGQDGNDIITTHNRNDAIDGGAGYDRLSVPGDTLFVSNGENVTINNVPLAGTARILASSRLSPSQSRLASGWLSDPAQRHP